MQTQDSGHDHIEELLEENARLIKENQVLLKKMSRNSAIFVWLHILWYVIIFGLPFVLYFFLLEPYVEALGSQYETFRIGISEIPALRGLEHFLP